MKRIIWNAEKNIWLKQNRNVTFDEILTLIEQGNVIDIIEHSNPDKYCGQKILLIKAEGYVYCVPFIEKEKEIWLKTIFPSRKYTKKYLGGERK